MIKVKIKQNSQKDVISFEMVGHADSGPYGQDIVCAAASVLAINTVNSVEQIAQMKPQIEEDEENGGLLKAQFPVASNHEQYLQVQAILKSFVIGMRDISQNYSQFIHVNISSL
ncbi:ribosomal-processing cysteine protease Prp [Pediococcus siamensis]|uniref:ribosomal-processing cysteine protease Prp n=1 Tax=Pediococcus siamensis TaxID=381829 RepID=UPI0039A17A9D